MAQEPELCSLARHESRPQTGHLRHCHSNNDPGTGTPGDRHRNRALAVHRTSVILSHQCQLSCSRFRAMLYSSDGYSANRAVKEAALFTVMVIVDWLSVVMEVSTMEA